MTTDKIKIDSVEFNQQDCDSIVQKFRIQLTESILINLEIKTNNKLLVSSDLSNLVSYMREEVNVNYAEVFCFICSQFQQRLNALYVKAEIVLPESTIEIIKEDKSKKTLLKD